VGGGPGGGGGGAAEKKLSFGDRGDAASSGIAS